MTSSRGNRHLPKEEEDSAIPFSQAGSRLDCGHSPNGEEVVLGTSQESVEAVGC